MKLGIDIIRKTWFNKAEIHDMRKGGDRLKVNTEAVRGRLCLSKLAMCEALGITPKTYNRYIMGSPIPSDVLERLHYMTGRSVDYLLGLYDDKVS